MRRRVVLIVVAFLAVSVMVIAAVLTLMAPQTSSIDTAARTGDRAGCLTDAGGDCLALPAAVGINLDNRPVAFPDALSDDLYLVVMPFDREQQVMAVTWLPLFQALAEQYGSVSFYSIAALPDLNRAVRAAVIVGMSLGVSDPAVRDQIAVLFLEEQAAFLDALAITDTSTIQVFIMTGDGLILWRTAGVYDEAAADALRDALRDLVAEGR